MNGCFADDLIIINHLDSGVADIFGSENTVSCNSSVVCSKRSLCGNLRSSTGRADTGRRDNGRRICGNILIFSSQSSMIKYVGRSCQRSNDKTVGDSALGTIGRTVADHAVVGAFILRHVGSRTAAVEVERVLRACFEHDLSKLSHRSAAGERLLTTVDNDQDNLVIFGNTHHRTGVTIGIIRTGCVDLSLAIPYKDRTKCLDRFLDTGICFVSVPLGNGLTHYRSAVFQDREKAGVAGEFLDDFSAHCPNAGRLTGGHVVTVTVSSGYNGIIGADKLFVVGIGVFRICSSNSIRKLLHTESIMLHILIGNLKHDVVARNVSSSYIVNQLLTVRFSVRKISILRNTGGKCLFRVFKHGVCRGIVVGIVIINDRRCRYREYRQRHDQRQNQSQNTF